MVPLAQEIVVLVRRFGCQHAHRVLVLKTFRYKQEIIHIRLGLPFILKFNNNFIKFQKLLLNFLSKRTTGDKALRRIIVVTLLFQRRFQVDLT